LVNTERLGGAARARLDLVENGDLRRALPARSGFALACEDREQCRLARAVAPDETDDLAAERQG
jgi:hypothetical protein